MLPSLPGWTQKALLPCEPSTVPGSSLSTSSSAIAPVPFRAKYCPASYLAWCGSLANQHLLPQFRCFFKEGYGLVFPNQDPCIKYWFSACWVTGDMPLKETLES